MIQDKKSLIETLEQHLDNIRAANDSFHYYKLLHQGFGEENKLAKFNIAPAFFSVTHNALMDSVFNQVMKLYDKTKGAESLITLLGYAQNNKKLFNEIIICEQEIIDALNHITDEVIEQHNSHDKYNQWQRKGDRIIEYSAENTAIGVYIDQLPTKLIAIEDTIKTIRTIRNKTHMHNDPKYFISPQSLPTIPVSDIEKLLSFAYEVCSKLFLNLTDRNYPHQSLNIDDFNTLLEHIKPS